MSLFRNRKSLLPAATLFCLCILFFFFPLFHVVSLSDSQAETARQTFDPSAFAEAFWNENLLPACDTAIPVSDLMSALRKDPDAARKRYARQVGLGNTHYYFVKGTATLIEKDTYALKLALDGGDKTDIIIPEGPVFGNTIRDGTGLLDINDYPNSRTFNQISAELNKRAEGLLERLWDGVQPGDVLSFAGCVEIIDTSRDHYPVKVVPVIAEVQ